MKALIASVLFAFSSVISTAQAETKDALIKKAESAYASREFSPAGIAKAQEAADAYAELAGTESGAKAQAKYFAAQSEALYFVGNASETKSAKIKWHMAGIAAADKALAAFGVSDITNVDAKMIESLKKNLSADELKSLGEALYNKGINLGQWGHANGVTESLGRWPELRQTMQVIIDLGMREIHDYGAFRVIGRGYHQIPGLFGGNNKKAEQYMKTAVDKTKVAGQIYSVNGFNTIYYAEILRDVNKAAEGKALLDAFVNADPASVNPKSVPEVKKAQADAKALLKDW